MANVVERTRSRTIGAPYGTPISLQNQRRRMRPGGIAFVKARHHFGQLADVIISSVPELTANRDIKLNPNISLHDRRAPVRCRHRLFT
jgi:hypothetical protein